MTYKIISIHQPCFLPWIGFFHKIICSDHFVFLDHVQVTKSGYDNRVKILINHQTSWVTVPIKKVQSTQKLNDTEIDNSTRWKLRLLRILKQSYKETRYFPYYWPYFEYLFSFEWKLLIDINLFFISFIRDLFRIKTPCVLSSNLSLGNEKSSDMNLKIVSSLHGSIYLSGAMGKNYLNEADFSKKNITIIYQDIAFSEYQQPFNNFNPGLSIIDFLFNCGAETVNYYLNNLKINFYKKLPIDYSKRLLV